jgi:hypothetical protein
MALAGFESVGLGNAAVGTSTRASDVHVKSAAEAPFESAAAAPEALARMFEGAGLSRGCVARDGDLAGN